MLVHPPPSLKIKCFEVILQPYTEYFEGCIWAWCTPSIPAIFAVLSSRRERMQWYFLFWIWKLGANQKRNRRKEKYDKSERIQKNLWNRKFQRIIMFLLSPTWAKKNYFFLNFRLRSMPSSFLLSACVFFFSLFLTLHFFSLGYVWGNS